MKFSERRASRRRGAPHRGGRGDGLAEDDEKLIQRMELRGNSRITATARATPGRRTWRQTTSTWRTPRTAARCRRAADRERQGRAARDRGAAGRRIAGRTIDIAMGSDGTTVTSLNAAERAGRSAGRWRHAGAPDPIAASLPRRARRAPASRRPSSSGNVDFRETRAATKDVAAIERTARSDRLDVKTKPGLRRSRARRLPRQRAFHRRRRDDRRGADRRSTPSRRIVSTLALADRDPGPGPHVANGRITVDAVAHPDGARHPEDEGRHQRPER